MKNIFFFFIFFVIIKLVILDNSCIENQNYCKKCHPLTNECIKCISDNFIPNNKGGCTGKCQIGKNYCNKCDSEGKLCLECQSNYYPDKVGSCSIVANCESSYEGICNKCEEDFILIGDEVKGFKFCKSKNSVDFKNCQKINTKNGLCEECKEGYFLNKGDFKCTSIENCYESTFGICDSCVDGYYLNKNKELCQQISDLFVYCKQTLDEKNCDKCNFNYYLAEDGQCTDTIMCSKTIKGICIECISGIHLLKDNSCSFEENCAIGDKDTALCIECIKGYYLDNKDKKCKSKEENNEFKHCLLANEGCKKCEEEYFLGEDLKCTKTEKCSESENDICNKCSEGYYLGKDHKCTKIEHCIFSGNTGYACDECEDNFYYNDNNKTCTLVKDNTFENCKSAIYNDTHCTECKNNFYLNLSDFLCYDNTKKDNIFYKCSITNGKATECEKCEKNYYLGLGNKKCSNIERCKFSENGDRCLACDETYCLDLNKNKCFDNDFLYEENKKFYIACNMTNEEGTACKECLEGYIIGEEGYCIDIERCEKKENNTCVKCKSDPSGFPYYCANKYFGCIESYMTKCIKCDNIFDLFSCTECEEGYKISDDGFCQKI